MASPNPSIAATTHTNYVDGDVVDAVVTGTPFLADLKEAGNIDYGEGGTAYRPPPIRYQAMPIEGWDGRNIGIVYEPDLFAYAEHPWAGYFNQWADNEWDVLENQEGPTRIADMYAETAKALKNDWAVFLETQLFTNGSTSLPAGFLGLPAFMKQTGTYGGIAQSNTWWQPYLLDGTTGLTPKTFATDPKAYLRRLMNQVALRQKSSGPAIGNRPNRGWTTLAIFEHLMGFYEQLQYQNATVDTETVGTNNMSLRAEGAKIYWSPSCTTQTLYVLRMEKLHLALQTGKMFGTRVLPIAQPIGNAYQTWMKGQLALNDPRGAGICNNIPVT